MAKIAYVDHSYHKKTISTKFLPNILEYHGHKIDYFWDEKWEGGKSISIYDLINYDVIIMFQSYCDIHTHDYFTKIHPNVVYIPMLDQFGVWRGPINNTTEFWRQFQGVKVLNFSTAAHGLTIGQGLRSKLVHYYQEPVECRKEISGLHGFLWVRLQDAISWQLIKKLIGNSKFDSFHLHLAVDPNTTEAVLPSDEDIEEYNITISRWFENKKDLEEILDQCNVYFVPRMEEGIGQSFLEALSRGQCIVSPDHGTMNEYVQNGFTGLLYDWWNPQPLDFSNYQNICKNAYQSAQYGYQQWKKEEDSIVDYILIPNKDAYDGRYNYFFEFQRFQLCKFIDIPINIFRAFRDFVFMLRKEK